MEICKSGHSVFLPLVVLHRSDCKLATLERLQETLDRRYIKNILQVPVRHAPAPRRCYGELSVLLKRLFLVLLFIIVERLHTLDWVSQEHDKLDLILLGAVQISNAARVVPM